MTDQCNLGCRYCYVKNRKTRLNLRAVDKLYLDMSQHLRNFGQVEYCISLFGGEPLLALPELEYVVKTFEHDPNCRYIVLVSNLSLLTEEIRDYLREHNIGVSWSWDALSDTRPFLDKSDPRAVYESKRDLILSLTRTVKCMITPRNVHQMVENAVYLRDFGVKTINMQYLYDPVWTADDIRKYARELRELAQFQSDNPEIDLTIFSTVYKLWEQGSCKEYPCFAGTTGFCLSTSGEIHPCQRYAQAQVGASHKSSKTDNVGATHQFVKLDKLCKGCCLEGRCLVGCSFSGLVPEVCTLHKITHKVAQELRYGQTRKNS